MSRTRMITLPSYFWHYLPLLYLTVIMHWFCVRSVSLTLFGIFLWYLVEMYNRMRWHVTYKNDIFGFLTFVVTSPSCLDLILCLLCNMNILWNILKILGRNVKQGEMTCWVQEWQRWLSYFWTYLPFLCLNLILGQSQTGHTELFRRRNESWWE